MSNADDRAATHLRRLGVNPATVARLRAYAEQDGMTLAEEVRFILNDYAPPVESLEEAAAADAREAQQTAWETL
jgi:hypothetical protein